MDLIIWAAAFVAFVIVEFATVQLVSIWFAAGALVTFALAVIFDLNIGIQLAVFVAASAVFLLITFPFLRKLRKQGFVSTNHNLDIGKNATVIKEINTDKNSGRVTLNGVDWSAVPSEKNTIIPVGSIVIIEQIEGSKLVVRLKE